MKRKRKNRGAPAPGEGGEEKGRKVLLAAGRVSFPFFFLTTPTTTSAFATGPTRADISSFHPDITKIEFTAHPNDHNAHTRGAFAQKRLSHFENSVFGQFSTVTVHARAGSGSPANGGREQKKKQKVKEEAEKGIKGRREEKEQQEESSEI